MASKEGMDVTVEEHSFSPHLLGVEYEPLPILILALLYRLQPLDPRQPRVQQLPHRAKLHTGEKYGKKYFGDIEKIFC